MHPGLCVDLPKQCRLCGANICAEKRGWEEVTSDWWRWWRRRDKDAGTDWQDGEVGVLPPAPCLFFTCHQDEHLGRRCATVRARGRV